MTASGRLLSLTLDSWLFAPPLRQPAIVSILSVMCASLLVNLDAKMTEEVERKWMSRFVKLPKPS